MYKINFKLMQESHYHLVNTHYHINQNEPTGIR
jgi:hypothetical protein